MSDEDAKKTAEEKRKESADVVEHLRNLMKDISPGIDKGVLILGTISMDAMDAENSEDFIDMFRALEALRAARDRIVEARAHLAVCHDKLDSDPIPEPKKRATSADPSLN